MRALVIGQHDRAISRDASAEELRDTLSRWLGGGDGAAQFAVYADQLADGRQDEKSKADQRCNGVARQPEERTAVGQYREQYRLARPHGDTVKHHMLLTTGPFELANEFVRWGIDPQFDAETVEAYGGAIAQGPEAVETLVEQLSREWERHTNMDY